MGVGEAGGSQFLIFLHHMRSSQWAMIPINKYVRLFRHVWLSLWWFPLLIFHTVAIQTHSHPQRDTPTPDKQAPCLRRPLPLPNSWPSRGVEDVDEEGVIWLPLGVSFKPTKRKKEKKKINHPPSWSLHVPFPGTLRVFLPWYRGPASYLYMKTWGRPSAIPPTDFSLLPMRYHC